ENETSGPGHKGRGEIGAHHVERAMGEVDEVHDAEHEREPRRQQEQQEAELQPVQELFDDKQHGDIKSLTYRGSPASWMRPPPVLYAQVQDTCRQDTCRK